jgi:hypothetical protein
MIHYVALDSSGEILGVEPTVDDAVDAALEAEPDKTVQVQELPAKSNPQETVPPAERVVAKAVKRMGLEALTGMSTIPSSAADMDLVEAHERVMGYFQGLRSRKDSDVKVYDTVSGTVDAWIGQNYKTVKEHPEQKSKVMGLTLTPHELVYQIARKPGLYSRKFTNRLKKVLPPMPHSFTFCAGSNDLCRDSCLVHAGQNSGPIYNTHRKAMQTAVLLNEPQAFMRLLVAAVQKHECVAPAEGYVPYMRLNVVSDIPWERVTPWLFELFPDLSFYDYTKVGKRSPPDNYELTFSFSGDNKSQCQREIAELGRKVAVVFLAKRWGTKKGVKGKSWVPIWRGDKAGVRPLPTTFWDLPVLDGDVSDVRPLDPVSPAIVGLRWKIPSGKRAGKVVDATQEKFTFVTPVYVVDGEAHIDAPFARPNPAREQFLISAATPRFENIIHDVGQPGL